MNPVYKALWFIESHFAEAPDLDDVADVAGVSRYHLTRAFGDVTGQSIMRYMRGRRLTIAARALSNGAPDILAVALEAGYGSHEAFTRAFREQFGATPEAVREQDLIDNLKLVEAIKMDENMHVNLGEPRIVQSKPMLIAGLNERYGVQSGANIPAQWQTFVPHVGSVPGQLGGTAYGVIYNGDDDGNYDYMCGVEVSDFSRLPSDLHRLRVPACKYAVFRHAGHVSGLRSSWSQIWSKSLPESGYELADAPIFERYGEEFDGRTGTGGVDLFVPIQ
jgi:AraC family transcriptional regulator